MKVTIFPGKLYGEFYAPPSKSAAHRALICAALSNGISRISHVGMSEDAKATMDGLCAFGAKISQQGETVEITGIQTPPSEKILVDCGESGSTLRFLIPIAACLGIPAAFNGRGRLPERTLQPFVEAFHGKGIEISYGGRLPFEIHGKLKPGEYFISGDISSQFISGLSFGLPLLSENSQLHLTTPLSSAPYVDMTIHMLRNFGVEIQSLPDGYFVPSTGAYTSGNFAVEGDYSGAAFYLAAGALFGNITCAGLDKSTRQGDREILPILEKFGGKVEWSHRGVTVCRQSLRGIEIDADAIPDLVPILAVVGAFAKGETRIVNASRLRLKESDRLTAMAQGLSKLGARVVEHPDALLIQGQEQLQGGCQVDSFSDHRVAMALSVAALGCKQPVEITGAQCVSKSYPGFFQDFIKMGGVIHGFSMGKDA